MKPRIRSIKPEIHHDEALWDLEVETGLPIFRAFTGLWSIADREGRFEWRPRALAPHILPYWGGDFSRVLDALTTRGFVVRYASGGREYGLVRTFTRHQVINNREVASELPPPPLEPEKPPTIPPTSTREERDGDASSTREARGLSPARVEGKGTEGNGREGRVADASHPSDVSERETKAARSALTAGYARRYEVAAGDAWMAVGPNSDHIQSVATWVAAKARKTGATIESVANELLDRVFADDWLGKTRWPWGAIAKDPAKCGAKNAASGVHPVAANPEAARIRAEMDALRKKLNGARIAFDYEAEDAIDKKLTALSRELGKVERAT